MIPHRILVPLDGSDFSRRIFPALRKHFPPERFELLLLRVERPAKERLGPDSILVRLADPQLPKEDERTVMVDRWVEAHFDPFDDQTERVQKQLGQDVRSLVSAGYRVTVAVRFGSPAREVVAAAEAHQVDLVAMATHGRTGLDHLLMGSVAEHVVRHLDVPLFVLRPVD